MSSYTIPAQHTSRGAHPRIGEARDPHTTPPTPDELVDLYAVRAADARARWDRYAAGDDTEQEEQLTAEDWARHNAAMTRIRADLAVEDAAALAALQDGTAVVHHSNGFPWAACCGVPLSQIHRRHKTPDPAAATCPHTERPAPVDPPTVVMWPGLTDEPTTDPWAA